MDTYSHEIISVGYNGTDPGKRGCLQGACPRGMLAYDKLPAGGNYKDCIARHAEENAIDWAEGGYGVLPSVYTMYITRPPCDDCKRMMTTRGIDWVYDVG